MIVLSEVYKSNARTPLNNFVLTQRYENVRQKSIDEYKDWFADLVYSPQ